MMHLVVLTPPPRGPLPPCTVSIIDPRDKFTPHIIIKNLQERILLAERPQVCHAYKVCPSLVPCLSRTSITPVRHNTVN